MIKRLKKLTLTSCRHKNKTSPSREIGSGIIPLQRLRCNTGLGRDGGQILSRPQRVGGEQAIISGDVSIATGAINSDVDESIVGNSGGFINVNSTHPVLSSKISKSETSNFFIGVTELSLVSESVAQEITV